MSVRSINVVIKPRHFFPWVKQKIQVDGQDTFNVKRSYSPLYSYTQIEQADIHSSVVKIERSLLKCSVCQVSTPERTYKVRKISYWQWECRCDNETIMVNRLGGIKCVLSKEGRQQAIMSLGSNMPFVKDKNTYIRVNCDEYLHIAMAVALVINGFGINASPLMLNNSNELSPMRAVEIA